VDGRTDPAGSGRVGGVRQDLSYSASNRSFVCLPFEGQARAKLLHETREERLIVQGKGLGTRFGVMLHAFAFRTLGLRRLYASIIPANAASLRLFAKLGYEADETPAARRYIDDPDDVTLSLTAERFDALHGALAARLKISARTRGSLKATPNGE